MTSSVPASPASTTGSRPSCRASACPTTTPLGVGRRRQMREAGDRLDPPTARPWPISCQGAGALCRAGGAPRAAARCGAAMATCTAQHRHAGQRAGAVRRHRVLGKNRQHRRPLRFAFALMDLVWRGLGALANRLLTNGCAHRPSCPGPHEEPGAFCRCSCRGGRRSAPMSIRPSRRSAARTTRGARLPEGALEFCSLRRRACWRSVACRAAARHAGAQDGAGDRPRPGRRRGAQRRRTQAPAGLPWRTVCRPAATRPNPRHALCRLLPAPSAPCGRVTASCSTRCLPRR